MRRPAFDHDLILPLPTPSQPRKLLPYERVEVFDLVLVVERVPNKRRHGVYDGERDSIASGSRLGLKKRLVRTFGQISSYDDR